MFALIVQYRKFLSLLLTVFISIWLMSRDIDRRFKIARGIQVTVLSPLQYVINKTTTIKNIFRLNRILMEENTRLKAENDILKEIRKENDILRNMIGYREKNLFTLVPAEVIARKTDVMSKNIIISAGVSDSVQKDMPVLSLDGVIGRIIECYLYHSNVQLINDPLARTGIIFERSNIPGILECGNNIPSVRTPVHSGIIVGERIITSGLGGIFPKGLFIGTVTAIVPADDLFKTVEITLNPGLKNIENVFVMKIKPEWKSFEKSQNP